MNISGNQHNVSYMHDSFRPSLAEADTCALDTVFPDAFEMFPDAIVLADGQAQVTYLNPAAEQLLGLPRHKVRGHALDKVIALQNRETGLSLSLSDISAGNPEPAGLFHLLSCSGGRLIPVQISVARTHFSHGSGQGFIVTLRNASELQHTIDKLVAQSMQDEHTQLLRRAELVKRLWRLLQEADAGEPHAFLYMDLDNFKIINDQAGHAAGDLAIRQVASRFKGVVRDRDTLARLGGDEFGLLLERCPVDLARERAQQLHQAVASYVLNWEGKTFQLGVSIGLALINTHNHSLNNILAAADTACYTAKRDGSHIHEVLLG